MEEIEVMEMKIFHQSRCILGDMIIQENFIEKVWLIAEDFEDQSHRALFCLLMDMKDDDMPIGLESVQDQLSNEKKYDTVGGETNFYEIVKSAIGTSDSNKYQISIRNFRLGKELIMNMQQAIKDPKALNNPISWRSGLLKGLNDFKFICDGEDLTIQDGLAIARQETIQAFEGKLTNIIPSGFKKLDDKIIGFAPGTLTIIAAKSGEGKSAFALNIIEKFCLEDKRVLLFSLELMHNEIANRLISAIASIPLNDIRTGFSEDPTKKAEYDVADQIVKEFTLSIRLSNFSKLSDFERAARDYKQEYPDLDLIVVDYLQLITNEIFPRPAEVASVSRALKVLSQELNIPIIALSQINEAAETRPDKTPHLSDLRESKAIGNDADLALFIHQRPERSECSVFIRKNRNGECGEIFLSYQKKYNRFMDLPDYNAEIVNMYRKVIN